MEKKPIILDKVDLLILPTLARDCRTSYNIRGCLHDICDQIGAAFYVVKSLKPDEIVMIVKLFCKWHGRR